MRGRKCGGLRVLTNREESQRTEVTPIRVATTEVVSVLRRLIWGAANPHRCVDWSVRGSLSDIAANVFPLYIDYLLHVL